MISRAAPYGVPGFPVPSSCPRYGDVCQASVISVQHQEYFSCEVVLRALGAEMESSFFSLHRLCFLLQFADQQAL